MNQVNEVILYHVSNPVFRDKIKLEGLTPQLGASYIAHYEDAHMGPVVFVSTENDYDSTWDDDRYKIVLPYAEFVRLNFQTDNEVKNGLYTSLPIEARFLILEHLGTGEG